MSRVSYSPDWKSSAVVRSFWKTVGGRTPQDAVIRVCDRMTKELRKKEPPFQSARYEYAELLGVRVIEENIPERSLQGILSKDRDGYLITLNQQDAPERRSFTVCHELGHVQMLNVAESALGPNRVLKDTKASREEERLSDLFAVNLLMPRRKFKQMATALSPSMKSLIELAGAFRTSVNASARRIVDLNIWPCALLSCEPQKILGGQFVVKINTFTNSASLVNPPISHERHVRWGIDAVCEAYDNKCLSRSTVVLREAGRQAAEHWTIECLYRESHSRDTVLALMVPKQ